MKLQLKLILSIAILFLVFPNLTPVFALEPYTGYNYDEWNEQQPAHLGYETDKVFRIADQQSKPLQNAQDMFICKEENTVYIADMDNNRILVTDMTFRFIREYSNIKGSKTASFNKPRGVCVAKDGTIFVADTDNSRVVAFDKNGNVKLVLEKPVSPIYPQTSTFNPVKVLIDPYGNIYVTVNGVYQGAAKYNASGEFTGFFGANRVDTTAAILENKIWKLFLTKQQVRARIRAVPFAITNFDIDDLGFIYTVTGGSNSQADMVKKLNTAGINLFATAKNGILRTNMPFGDVDKGRYVGSAATSLEDINVDYKGNINLLDYSKGRVFQYDKDCNLLFIFGLNGEQEGTFGTPTAVSSIGDEIYVLDGKNSTVTTFKPTEFGLNVKKALDLYNQGYYKESKPLWEKILNSDSGYTLAYKGMAAVYMSENRYTLAMESYKRANDREGYNKAYQAYRANYLKSNFLRFFEIFMLLAVLLTAYSIVKRKNKKVNAFVADVHKKLDDVKYSNPFYYMIHPNDGFEEVRWKNKGSLASGYAVVAFLFIALIMNQQFTGYIFNNHYTKLFNVAPLFFQSIFYYIVFAISNWAVCTLMDGIGTFRKILIAIAYSLTPFVMSTIICSILSNFLIRDESTLLNTIMVAGFIWSGFMIFVSLSTIHNYTPSRTVVSILLTLFAFVVIVFLIVLILTLMQQITVFLSSVWSEYTYRFGGN